MVLRFFFDECADEDVAAALRSHEVEVQTTSELGRKGLADEEQLSFGATGGRVVYTTDQDFLRVAHQWLQEGRTFAGIAYHEPGQRSKRDILEMLLLMNAIFGPEDMLNRIEFLSFGTIGCSAAQPPSWASDLSAPCALGIDPDSRVGVGTRTRREAVRDNSMAITWHEEE